jgi:hypothetical protein
MGADHDHVHVLVQLVLNYSPVKIFKIIKDLTAQGIFKRMPTVKRQL